MKPKELKDVRGTPSPAKLYITEAAESAKKALAEKAVPDPEDKTVLENLIEQSKKGEAHGNA